MDITTARKRSTALFNAEVDSRESLQRHAADLAREAGTAELPHLQDIEAAIEQDFANLTQIQSERGALATALLTPQED